MKCNWTQIPYFMCGTKICTKAKENVEKRYIPLSLLLLLLQLHVLS